MAILFAPPRFKATDRSNAPISGAFLQFLQFQTSTPQPIYTDSTLQIELLNPLKADANGLFPEIWLDDSLPPYKAVFSSPDSNDPSLPGSIIWTIQQYNATLSADSLTLILNPRTPAEIVARVTPTNYAYAAGDVRRYGFVGNNVADDTTPVQTAINVYASGGAVPYIPPVTWKITAEITIPTLLILDLGQSTIAPIGSVNAFTLNNNVCGVVNGFLRLTGTTGRGIYAPSAIAELTFRDLHIICGAGTGIELVDCFGVYGNNIRLESGSGHGLHVRTTIPSTPSNSMIFDRLSTANFTSATDVILLEAVAGIIIRDIDSENHTSGANDIRITANSNSGTVGVTIDGAYFEAGPSLTGSNIQIDKGTGTGTAISGVKISRTYHLTSKTAVSVTGTGISDDLEICSNVFQGRTGAPTYMVSVPAGFVPNCHSNTGSQQDLNRSFTPTLTFAGNASGQTGTYAGRYLRIGNRITGEFQITLTAKGSSTGTAVMGGLPKASYSSSNNNAAGINFASNLASLTQVPIGRIAASATTVGLSDFNSTGTFDITDSNFTNTSIMYGWFSYEVDG